MIKLAVQLLVIGVVGAAALPAWSASVDELILACEKLKRAEDRASCFKEAIRASSASPGTKAQGEKEAVTSAAQGVVKALRRLGSAASVGITLRDYSQLVVTESANIDEGLRNIPEGLFKESAIKARQAYIDAREIWSESIQEDYLPLFRIRAETILKRYAIEYVVYDLRLKKPSDIPKSSFLSPIWTAADQEAESANSAIATIMNPRPSPQPPASVNPPPMKAAEAPQLETKPEVRRKPTADDHRVVKILKHIDDAADTKPGLVEYSKVISADIAEIDQALRDMPDDEFRNHVVIARQAYIDAREVWALSDQHQYLSMFVEAARPQLRRYLVSVDTLNATGNKEMRYMPKHLFLFPIWRTARLRIDDAERLLSNAESTNPAKPAATAPRKP